MRAQLVNILSAREAESTRLSEHLQRVVGSARLTLESDMITLSN
jgi:hypothetical protein